MARRWSSRKWSASRRALLDDTVKQRDEAYSVLMRGMVQLPDYLERVQSGHKDIPIVLLPLLNDLRACRGDNLLTESALFSPDLLADLPASLRSAQRSARSQPRTAHAGAASAACVSRPRCSSGSATKAQTEHLDRLNERARSAAHDFTRQRTTPRVVGRRWRDRSRARRRLSSRASRSSFFSAASIARSSASPTTARTHARGEAAARSRQESSLLRRALDAHKASARATCARPTVSTRCCRRRRNCSTRKAR